MLFWNTALTRIPFASTLSTIESTSIPGLMERRSKDVPLATAEDTSEGSAVRVTVRAAAFTVCHFKSMHMRDNNDKGGGGKARSSVTAMVLLRVGLTKRTDVLGAFALGRFTTISLR